MWPMKPTAPRDVEREHWEERKVFFVCVCGGGEKEQGKDQVPTVSSPSLPAVTNREVST